MLKYYFQKYMRLYSFRSYKNYYGYSIEAPAHSKKTIEISYDDGPNLIHIKAVSYTHLTLPTKRIV